MNKDEKEIQVTLRMTQDEQDKLLRYAFSQSAKEHDGNIKVVNPNEFPESMINAKTINLSDEEYDGFVLLGIEEAIKSAISDV